MLLGAGISQEVDFYKVWASGGRKSGRVMLNPEGVRTWQPGKDCIWRQNGVWDMDGRDQPVLLRPGHFTQVKGQGVDFSQDYLRPFLNRFAEGVRSVDPKAIIFVESEFGHRPPIWGPEDAKNIVWAPHWYDGFTLILKRFSFFIAANALERSVVIGMKRIWTSFVEQVGKIIAWADSKLGGAPSVIGEFGIPYDPGKKKAFDNGDFSA